MDLANTLEILIIVLVCIIFVLLVAYVLILFKNKKEENASGKITTDGSGHQKTSTGLSNLAIKQFMEFDEVKDSMIVRKNRTQYVMIIKCKGVNYDLMSEEEKVAVEAGFVQFLNILRYPVQLYVQTTSLNLKDIISGYSERLKAMQMEIQKIESDMQDAKQKGNTRLYNRLGYEKRRKENTLEYTADISDYISKLSLNQNVLQQKSYIVISYYASEIGNIQNISKDEIDNLCFSELYTRAQTIIHALSSSGVTGKVLDSEELAELLYAAYNRDESEVIQLSKALDAEYDALYSTGKDVLEKRKAAINEKIEKEAIDLATESITKADEKIRNQQRIMEKAMEIVGEYKDQMSDSLYEETINEISNSKNEKEKSQENTNVKTPVRRGRPKTQV